ncbi:MAG: metalloregulator ArsR/SmtB family transcription factor [Candidatus Thermoplasmatota archaeon]|nr:metalloregulator ArsR/SmtB family transcription factor [Candidatus Thermoplasmatota archaeon]
MPKPDSLSPKKALFEQFARLAKAMASANRLELLETLAQGERSVDALAEASQMSIANTSHHLQVLREGGLVESRKEGVQVFYRLKDEAIPALLSIMGEIAERQLAEVERIVREHFASKDGLQPLRREELIRQVLAGEAVVIDVRPEGEYRSGHIQGAVNIPLEDLPKRLTELPKDQEIVAYCRGPYCILAYEAVEQLRKHGYRSRRLEGGFPEWKAERYPTAQGDKK